MMRYKRTRVSRSRPCIFGESSLATLMRVCDAIRADLAKDGSCLLRTLNYSGILGLLSCLKKWPIAELLKVPEPHQLRRLIQVAELFQRFLESGLTLAKHFGRSTLERLFRWNT